MGVFEIRTSETLHNDEEIIAIYIRFDDTGELKIMAAYVHLFTFYESIASVNILRSSFKIFYFMYLSFYHRKWSRLCISYDFLKNEAQLAFSGHVTALVRDPDTRNDLYGNGEVILALSVLNPQTQYFY